MKTRTWRVVALTILFTASLAAAPVSPEVAAKIDQLFAKWNHRDTPGVIVAVARDGETIFSRAYGMANLEHGIPLTSDTVTESGSVAKQFTAAAVVLLAQRGKLSLDDPIRKHLPEMPAALADRITVRMLLNHTSGLRDIHGLFDLMGRPSYTSAHDNAEVLRVMSRQRQLNFAPGAEYLYCNAAFVLAAIIVQRASGQPFGAFCEEQVFRPHGLTHTHWRSDFTALVPGRATGYEPRPGGGYQIDSPYSNIVGNGGLFFTAGDLLKWNASLDETAGEWGEVVRTLQTRSKLSDGRAINYGLGIGIDDYAGLKEISHGGATSGYKTFLARFPERHLSLVLLGNAGEFNPSAVSRPLLRLVLDLPAPTPPARAKISAEALAACAGHYHSKQTDDLVNLTVKDGKLFSGGTAELIPTGPGTFANAAGTTTFAFAEAPRRQFTLTTGNGVVTFDGVSMATPRTAQLAAYAGTYQSEELEVTHILTSKEGRLSAERWPTPAWELKPTFADGFTFGPGWHATFTRDANGAITGYELTNGRCRRVKFVRH
jgi:CubicO group peptidase (beta-lactamase class C family)